MISEGYENTTPVRHNDHVHAGPRCTGEQGIRRSRMGGDLEGRDSEIVQLEPVNVKWLDGLGKEDSLLLPESHGRCLSNPCRECIQPVLSVASACDGGET